MSTVLQKNVTVIKFAQCRVSIDFSCYVSKIQNKYCPFPTYCPIRSHTKYYPFPTYCPIRSRTSTVLRKNAMVIKFAQIQVSIDFSCKVVY
ncbi:hypothetical protein GW17_00059843 [Ensete ventricosum]|nr:hypothetical protein GW17_00059843 [Ensete ventricosum]